MKKLKAKVISGNSISVGTSSFAMYKCLLNGVVIVSLVMHDGMG